ncbi:MAG: malate dehydrogenase, partial [Elusimicrobiota bacterium]|nr:malate dehydrogenase [Elusimicrobiota bacterium]
MKINLKLDNVEESLPSHLSSDEKAQAKTLFFKKLALKMHKFYGGKIGCLPKAGVFDLNWFNVW